MIEFVLSCIMLAVCVTAGVFFGTWLSDQRRVWQKSWEGILPDKEEDEGGH
jgi:hypothetical protein